MPAGLGDISYVTDGSNGHDTTEKLNVRSPSSWEATLKPRTPDNATRDQQTIADDMSATVTDTIQFKQACNTGHETILSMDNMWINVDIVIRDLEKGIYQMSTDWAEDLPGNEDITVWLHVDIFDPNPELVHTVLIRNMFQLVVYNTKCYGRRFTKGGSILAMRAGQRNRKLASVSIYAVDRGDW
ncbi:hypothetical protein G6011_03712 [Alternaria panax]|uniref:Uncharacterized protein n=1 Tax=Alternaria panax TaxID=48097 RepID=A0AAD4IF63_9PLEO|nr:hypothetical protein G6011_03712 [Alternaria panax]